MAKFDTIEDIPSALLETIETLGFTDMSDIQDKAINPILEGRDILAQSKNLSLWTALCHAYKHQRLQTSNHHHHAH